jgi:hypothetical protein
MCPAAIVSETAHARHPIHLHGPSCKLARVHVDGLGHCRGAEAIRKNRGCFRSSKPIKVHIEKIFCGFRRQISGELAKNGKMWTTHGSR